MENEHLLRKIQKMLYIGQWHLSPLPSRYLGTSHSSNLHQTAPSYFLECHLFSEISSFSKLILVLGETRSHKAPNLSCMGPESPGWFDVLPKNSAWDVMHEQACCCDEAANCQLPIATGFWIILRWAFKLHAKFDADSMLYWLSHFECDGHAIHKLT